MTETILGGILIAVVSGVIGKSLGDNDSIKQPVCTERQHACQSLLIEKIDNVTHKVDILTKIVNNKLLGI